MSDKLTEQELDLLVYVVDVWLQANDGSVGPRHPAFEKVDRLSEKLSKCDAIKVIG